MDQKIVLITGANKGIGFATARALAAQGHVVLMGARDEARGAEATAAIEGTRFVHLDVTDQASIEAAAQIIERDHGRLDVLINNAGISRYRERPSELPVPALREVFETNTFGVVADTNAMLLLGYNASKAALNAITLMYAMELRDTAIKVNAVSPGFAATDLNDHRGVITAEEGGAHVARLALVPADGPTGVFLSEQGGTYPW